MTKEELDKIEELIQRKIAISEAIGGLNSSDKQFIKLWNYTMELQNNWNELKDFLKQKYNDGEKIDIKDLLNKMQEIESR